MVASSPSIALAMAAPTGLHEAVLRPDAEGEVCGDARRRL